MSPIFSSLGIFIIDEIHFADGQSIYNVFGGGGSFAIVGSRMVLGPQESKSACWVVDIGNDCPPEIQSQLESWNTGAIYRNHPDRPCNHGWNKYGANEFRQFKYTTPKMEVTLDDLDKHHLLDSQSFHFLLSPSDCTSILDSLDRLGYNPLIVWEPEPDDCTDEMLTRCLPVLSRIDVLSPNAAECASFLGLPEPLDKPGCEQVAIRFVPYMTKTPDSAVVMRCGALGCLLMTRTQTKWFPPYHTTNIVDPTGCGNTFVGALATGLVKSGDLQVGCICGTLAAGAAIELHGVPLLSEGECWNGMTFQDRAKHYLGEHYNDFIDAIK